jgi:hypothetical protein
MTKSRKNVSRRKNRKSLKKQKTNRRRMSGGAWWHNLLTEDEKQFLLNVEWKAPNNYPSQKLTDPDNKLNNLHKEKINGIINMRTNEDIKTIQELQNKAVNNELPEKYYMLFFGLNSELKNLGGA